MGNETSSSAGGKLMNDAPEELRAMIEAAQLAGREIRTSWFSRTDQVASVTKSNSADLQTEVDRKCESLVVSHLRTKFPSYQFIGEESSAESGEDLRVTADPTFIIDPIDGTTNFVHTLLSCSVLISFMHEKQIQSAVILDPIHLELFFAWRAGGAWHCSLEPSDLQLVSDPSRLETSKQETLSLSVVATDIGSHRKEGQVNKFVQMQKALLVDGQVRGLRVSGGCGLGLAYVAAGRLDAYVEDCSPCIWDFASGSLIVQEAGGFVCDTAAEVDIDWEKRNVLAAASRPLAQKILALVAPFCQPKSESN